jgi:hypothetical protein
MGKLSEEAAIENEHTKISAKIFDFLTLLRRCHDRVCRFRGNTQSLHPEDPFYSLGGFLVFGVNQGNFA